MRTMRWRWWRLIAAARLRRLGGRLVVDAAAAPRLDGPLRLETGPSPGTLTLRIGRAVRIGRDCVLDLADGADGVVELADGALLQSRVRLQPWRAHAGPRRVRAQVQGRAACRRACRLRAPDLAALPRGDHDRRRRGPGRPRLDHRLRPHERRLGHAVPPAAGGRRAGRARAQRPVRHERRGPQGDTDRCRHSRSGRSRGGRRRTPLRVADRRGSGATAEAATCWGA